jgi:hypothetical protein
VSSSDNHRGYFSSLDHTELNKDPAKLGKLADNKEGFFFGSDSLIAPGNRTPEGCEQLQAKVGCLPDQCLAYYAHVAPGCG